MEGMIVAEVLMSSSHKSTKTCMYHCFDGFENWSEEFSQDPEDDC
jgi:hypothetical protein